MKRYILIAGVNGVKCDLIAFYDNSESFRRFAIYRNGSPVRLSKNIPEWYEKYVCEHTER